MVIQIDRAHTAACLLACVLVLTVLPYNLIADVGVIATPTAAEGLHREAAQAYAWLGERTQTRYIAVGHLTRSDALDGVDVLWWHHAEGVDLPDEAVELETLASVKDYVQQGGGLLLTGFAPQYVCDLGLNTQRPSTLRSEPGISGNWGIAKIKPHPIFEGLPEVFRIMSDGFPIENRLCWWDDAEDFEGEWLGDVERRGGIVAVGEYAIGKGKVVVLGVGANTWDTGGALNLNQSNLSSFTSSILTYLGASDISDPGACFDSPRGLEGTALHVTMDPVLDQSVDGQPEVVSYLRKPIWRDGVEGKALDFDGYSTYLRLPPGSIPMAGDALTVEARAALRAYPANSAPIINQYDEHTGFSLEVTSYGRLLCRVYAGSSWITVVSPDRLPLGRWLHLAATYCKHGGLTLYVDGDQVAHAGSNGDTIVFTNPSVPAMIGRDVRTPFVVDLFPTGMFNGLIDDVRVSNQALLSEEIAEHAVVVTSASNPDLSVADRFVDDPHRPIYHGMPDGAWTNEPHGLIYLDGTYHLFYQSNPAGPYWNFIRWGHLTSDDLVHWRQEPIALEPDKDAFDSVGVWSGCTVVDNGILKLLYTGVNGRYAGIGLASLDKDSGTFNKSSSNPIIDGRPEEHFLDFRDPFVWRDGDLWRLIIGAGVPEVGGVMMQYTTRNLEDWDYRGVIFDGKLEESSHFWEMPVMLDFQGRQVLLVSEVPGRASYWVGRFDGERFVPDVEIPNRLELMNNLLSPTVAKDAEGRTVAIGIIPEKRSSSEQLKAGWAHVFSLPRVWSLSGNGIIQQAPHPSLTSLRGEEYSLTPGAISPGSPLLFESEQGDTLEMELVFEAGSADQIVLALRRSPKGEEQTTITYDTRSHRIILDRSRSSLTNIGPAAGVLVQQGSARPGTDGTIRMHVFIDRSVVECFVNEGDALAARVYPSRVDSKGIAIRSIGGEAELISGRVWPMRAMRDVVGGEAR